jgi:hypothetical protein
MPNRYDSCPRCKKRNKDARNDVCSVCSSHARRGEHHGTYRGPCTAGHKHHDIEERIAYLSWRASRRLPLFED